MSKKEVREFEVQPTTTTPRSTWVEHAGKSFDTWVLSWPVDKGDPGVRRGIAMARDGYVTGFSAAMMGDAKLDLSGNVAKDLWAGAYEVGWMEAEQEIEESLAAIEMGEEGGAQCQ